ncbi:MAG: hypothetical protein Q4A76_03730 [Porphyromonadaceae bacterium]|nr:hypothetical protein [Porphyromonadaceae bacterium]
MECVPLLSYLVKSKEGLVLYPMKAGYRQTLVCMVEIPKKFYFRMFRFQAETLYIKSVLKRVSYINWSIGIAVETDDRYGFFL